MSLTLANMRSNGVRSLAIYCNGRACSRYQVLDVSAWRA